MRRRARLGRNCSIGPVSARSTGTTTSRPPSKTARPGLGRLPARAPSRASPRSRSRRPRRGRGCKGPPASSPPPQDHHRVVAAEGQRLGEGYRAGNRRCGRHRRHRQLRVGGGEADTGRNPPLFEAADGEGGLDGPAAPRVCPVYPLVEKKGTCGSTAASTRASVRSLSGVAVPWALTKAISAALRPLVCSASAMARSAPPRRGAARSGGSRRWPSRSRAPGSRRAGPAAGTPPPTPAPAPPHRRPG